MARVVGLLGLVAMGCWLAFGTPESSTLPTPVAPDTPSLEEAAAAGQREPRLPVALIAPAMSLALPDEDAASPAAPEPFVLAFSVVDQLEQPVVGARALVHAGGEDWHETQVVAEARSDAEGHVSVALPEALRDSYGVEIQAAGFLPWLRTSESWRSIAGRTHTLVSAVRVTGVVRDAASLQPLSGAVVRWKDTEPMTTASDGRYEVTMPSRQLGGLIVVHPDYPVEFTVQPLTAPGPAETPIAFDVLLEREPQLDLLVVDRVTGAPLEGVTLRYWEWLDVTATDAHGRVAHALDARLVDFRKDGYVTLRWRPGGEPLPTGQTLRVPLQPLAWVQGRTVDSDGRPLDDVEISRRLTSGELDLVSKHSHSSSTIEATPIALVGLPGQVEEFVVDGSTIRSAPDGSFRVGVRPGPEGCVLRATLDGRVQVMSERLLLTAPHDTANVELTLQLGGRLELSVLRGTEHARSIYVVIEDHSGARVVARQSYRKPLLTPQLSARTVHVTVHDFSAKVVVADLDLKVIVGQTTAHVIQLDTAGL